jgi:hypothetical protein
MAGMANTPHKRLRRPFYPIALYYFLISLMVFCFSFIVIQTINRLNPAWNGNYLLIIGFLITLLSLYSHRYTREFAFLTREWMLYNVSEWVIILIALKALLYLVNDPSQFFIDLQLWRQDFIRNFFTVEYVLVVLGSIGLWVLSGAFTSRIYPLENDPELLEQERQGFLSINRHQIRFNLMTLIFILGGIMLFLATVTNIEISFLPKPSGIIQPSIAALIIYFILGLTLLSQSQFSILDAHWYIEAIPESEKIASFWFPASILLLLVVAGIVIFLPTRYSVGLFALIQSLISVILAVVTFLNLVFFGPLVALLALLARLFGVQKNITPEAAPQSMPQLPHPVAQAPVPWWELVKSIIFWAIFISIIIFALRYYFNQHKGMFSFLNRLGIWAKVIAIWNWLKFNTSRLNKGISSVVSAGVKKLQALRPKRIIDFNPLSFISRNLPARHRILLIYLTMVRWNNQFGIQRLKSQTPYEYAKMIDRLTPEIHDDLATITTSFIEARYTRHPINDVQANQVQTAWDNMQQTLKRFFNQEKQGQE